MGFKKDRLESKPVEPAAVSEWISQSGVAGIISATLNSESKKYILDFGTISQDTVDFFGKFSCQYDVIDVYEILLEIQALTINKIEENTPEENFKNIESRIKDLLLTYGAQKYDAIFLWDQLNYMQDWQVKKIFSLIEPLCHWKTYVLAVFPMQKKIPAKPLKCAIIDYDTICYKANSNKDNSIKNPEYGKVGFSLLSPGFGLYHSSLSRHGFKECLFSIKRKWG